MLWISRFNYMNSRYNSIYTGSAFYKAREDYSFFASEIGLKMFDMFSFTISFFHTTFKYKAVNR